MNKISTLLFSLFIVTSLSAQTFTMWTFEGNVSTPSLGSGTLTNIGGVTSIYGTGSNSPVAYTTKNYPLQGTASGTAGVQFQVSTATKTGIKIGWVQRTSRAASKYVQFQYTVDGANWITPDLTPANTAGTTQGIDYTNDLFISVHKIREGKDFAFRFVDLTGVAGVDNNANFGFRVVSVFAPATTQYAPSKEDLVYNNTAGGIRFDDVSVGENSVLPLLLVSFNALTGNNNNVSLSWVTNNEVNVSRFDVEKSVDASHFNAIGEVAAKNIISGAEYSFADTKLLTPLAFYRLKIIDKDGAYKYSGILKVTGSAALKISVYPNPVAGNLVLAHPKAVKGASLKIVSADGKTLAVYSVQEQAIQTNINVYNLTKGNYFIIYQNGSEKQSSTFMKQ